MIRWMIVAIVALGMLGGRRTGSIESSEPPPAEPAVVDAIYQSTRSELKQRESVFAFEVLERVADRTIDDLRSVDVNVNGLLAVQAAIYAILIDKLGEFNSPLRVAFVTVIVLTAANLVLGRGRNVPDPLEFLEMAEQDPTATRARLVATLLERSKGNEGLLVWKRTLFWVALGLTIVISVAAPLFEVVHSGSKP